jgi:hypothetical protein
MELDQFVNQTDSKFFYVKWLEMHDLKNFKESSSRQTRRFHGRKINRNHWELGPRVAFEMKNQTTPVWTLTANLSVREFNRTRKNCRNCRESKSTMDDEDTSKLGPSHLWIWAYYILPNMYPFPLLLVWGPAL